MKKLLTIVLMAAAAISANAQNVQVHYDFGRHLYPDQEEGRQSVTMTLEQFKADKWGSWYYFVDVDFSNKFVEGRVPTPRSHASSTLARRALPPMWSMMVD